MVASHSLIVVEVLAMVKDVRYHLGSCRAEAEAAFCTVFFPKPQLTL